jgi:hypothetical protein
MSVERSGLAHSVQVRLARHAKEIGVDPNFVLTRYAVERFLYRLSHSAHAERFVLKGALLLLVWLGETLRPTRDADLLGFGELSDDALVRIFREVCTVEVEQDAATCLTDTVLGVAAPRCPRAFPAALGDGFASDVAKQAQWRAFLRKNRINAPALAEVVADIRTRLAAPLAQARKRKAGV